MKIALLGYGKMGKAIEEISREKGKDNQFILKINKDNLAEATEENIARADVAIEFSTPESAFENIRKCLNAGVPVVSGTTGWLDKLNEAEQLCRDKNGAFLYASNFSVGVNIFFELNRKLAEMMNMQEQYEIEIRETHHTEKKDAPSGTAITIAKDILDKINRKKSWVNEASEKPGDLNILSYRKENVPGTHTVAYTSDVDDIEITHTAHSRKGFAEGALLAAEWLRGKKGIFTMKDVLGV